MKKIKNPVLKLTASLLIALASASSFATTYVYRQNMASNPIHHSLIRMLIPLYSGPASDPVDWRKVEWASSKIPLAVVVNPNNGPGHHIYSDYLPVIQKLEAKKALVLGYIPTNNGKKNFSVVWKDVVTYHNKYHTNGIFLDEMPSSGTKTHLRYYHHIAYTIHEYYPHMKIFGNPGINFSRKFMNTGINTFVDDEDIASNVNAQPQSKWVNKYSPIRFAEITLATVNDLKEIDFLRATRHIGYLYVTNQTLQSNDGNPYATLPTDFGAEVIKLVKLNR